MSGTNVLSQNELDDLRYVLSLSKKGEAHRLDFSDPAQHRFYLKQLSCSNASSKEYPQFFKTLEETRKLHIENGGPLSQNISDDQEIVDINAITDAVYNTYLTGNSINSTPDTGCFASALSSIAGGTIFTHLTLQIIDIETGNDLGTTDNPPVYGQGECSNIYVRGTAAQGNQGVRVIYTYSYQKYNQAPVFQNIHMDLNDEPVGVPDIQQPVLQKTHTGMKYITFGIGRQQGYVSVDDCDYYWYEQNQNNPIVRMPLVGSQKFRSRITSSIEQNNIVCYMVLVDKGGGGIPITNTTDLLQGITISASDPTMLSFNFPYNYDLTLDKSIQFGKATFDPDSQVILFLQVQVKTQNSGDDFVSACIYGLAPSSSLPNPPWSPSGSDIPGMYVMRPLKYTWHCVSAETLVKLADGTAKRIDELKGGDTVLSDSEGHVLKVTSTVFADKDAEIYSISDEYGHNILITENHGIITDNGIRLAKDISVGDILITENGHSKVTKIDLEPYKGRVWGINLSPLSENEDISDDKHTFYANGILIGDMYVSYHEYKQHKYRLENILKKLDEKWHVDAMSSHKHYNPGV
jgi:hypothetical protein